jgi:hypothetical protein
MENGEKEESPKFLLNQIFFIKQQKTILIKGRNFFREKFLPSAAESLPGFREEKKDCRPA